MSSVTVVSVGDTPNAVVAALGELRGAVTIVRQCPELAQLLAASQSGLAAVALIAQGSTSVTATLVDRLNAVGVSVVALADQADELVRLRGLGVTALNSSIAPAALAQALEAAGVANHFTDATGFSGGVDGGGATVAESRRSHRARSAETTAKQPTDQQADTAELAEEINQPGMDASKSPDVAPETMNTKQKDVPAKAKRGFLDGVPGLGTLIHKGKSGAKSGAGQTTTSIPDDRSLRRRWPAAGHGQSVADVDHGPMAIAQAEIIAVWGPIGSPGRTTLAVNLAAELALLGKRVLLIDADTYGASVAAALGLLDESAAFAQACRAADQGSLTGKTLASMASDVVFSGGSFSLLSGLTRPDRWPELRAAAVERVFETARSLVDSVVIDCGFCLENDEELSYDQVAPRRNATTISALGVADTIFAVGQADAIGMPRLVRALNEMSEVRSTATHATLKVVFNKMRKRGLGDSAQADLRGAWDRFGPDQEIAHFLPYEPEVLDRALLEGRLLVELSQNSPLRLGIKSLACAHVQGSPETLVARATAVTADSG